MGGVSAALAPSTCSPTATLLSLESPPWLIPLLLSSIKTVVHLLCEYQLRLMLETAYSGDGETDDVGPLLEIFLFNAVIILLNLSRLTVIVLSFLESFFTY